MRFNLTCRGRRTYKTRSNRKLIKKTMKNLVYMPADKKGNATKCGSCGMRLLGVAAQRPAAFARLRKSQRTVARAYGGCLCATCLMNRILDGLLTKEEALIGDEINAISVS
ncbi:60S ribosomal protein L34-A [Astathelohania contejeani]|uniref:60S ribosomal protein L34-A n=1 Tax=Astathelohania contejeani TaxID=164912 RepID=A0ABQ7I1A8_9MICR|nr:60S ribosomal protein L34-A [Thelohania contejeani]